MINHGNVKKENIREHNPSCPQIFDHPYRILIIESSGSEKTNSLFDLIKQQNDDDYNIFGKIYLYVKDPKEAKYQYLVLKQEKTGLEGHEDQQIAIEYSNNMQDV